MKRRQWIKRTWPPPWARVAVSVASFPCFLIASWYAAVWIFQTWTGGFGFAFATEPRALATAIVTTVIVAWLCARALYAWLSYRRIRTEVECCWRCGYDLTANVSGICPECGISTRLELSPKALFFLSASVLKSIRIALTLWLVPAVLQLALSSRFILGPDWWGSYSHHPIFDRLWQLLIVVMMVAVVLLSLSFRRVAETSKLANAIAAIGFGSSILAVLTQVVFLSFLGARSNPEIVVQFVGVISLVSMPMAAISFHLISARLMGRVPRGRSKTALYAAAVLILATALLWFFMITHITILWPGVVFLLPFAAMLSSVLSVSAAVYRVHRVLRQRRRYDATQEWPTEPA